MLLAIIIPVVLFTIISPYNRRYKNIAWLAYMLFSLFFCFRGEIATDWQAYKMYYDNVFNDVILNQSGFEVGFIILCRIFNWLGCSYWIFNSIVSLVIVIVVYKAINVYTDDVGLALLLAMLYFFYPSLEALRQMLVVALFFYSLQFLEKNPKKYFVINIIAVLFHKTAILALIFLLVYKVKKTRILFVIAMVEFPLLQPFLEKILVYIPTLYQKYTWYVIYMGGLKDYSYIFSFKTIEYIVVILILVYLRKRQSQYIKNDETADVMQVRSFKSKDREAMECLVLLLLGMGLLIHLSLGRFMDSTYRLLYYSDVGLIMGVCFIYDRLRRPYQRFSLILVVDLYIILKFMSIINANPELFGI